MNGRLLPAERSPDSECQNRVEPVAEGMYLRAVIISEDHSEQSDQAPRPHWMRVLAMEIMRGLCSDAELMCNVWARYDAHHSGSNVFTALITALKRLVTEKPAVLGVSTQMFGVGVQPDGASSSGYGLDVAGMAGIVATAASATVSGCGRDDGLQRRSQLARISNEAAMLDKADAPPIPESYIYLLAVQCIVSLCEGFAAFTGPMYSTIVIQRPRAAGEAVIRAPPALGLASLPEADPSTVQLRIVSAIIESGWPALLAALSFIIATNLSDNLFVEVLASYRAMTNVAGMLGLVTPRDAFFTSLSKFAVPTRVVSSLDHSYGAEAQTPRSAASLSENLGFSTGPAQPPGLSERNLACLKVLVASSLFLAGSLGESWFGILEALQNADYVLTSEGAVAPGKRGPFGGSGSAPGSHMVSGSGGSRHALLSDLDPEALQTAIQRLFDASKNLEDDAFRHFINALSKSNHSLDELPSATLSPRLEPAHRRRVSRIHLPRTLRSGDFGINKLGGVAHLNIHRLIYCSPDVAWDTTTNHLLSVICLTYAPQAIRVQAARVLDEILVIVPRNLTTTGSLQAEVQKCVLDVLAQQVVPDYLVVGGSTTTSVELRRMGLETLHQILEASGHALVVGWETIFQILASVCKPPPPARTASLDSISVLSSPSSPVLRTKPMPLGLGNPSEKSYTALVKIAFQSLTLVCDSVSSLSPSHLRLCISTLGQNTSRALDGAEWPLDRLTRLMAILKGILTYPSSPDYRPDIDQLPPVQAIVVETIVDLDLSAPGCPSLVMRDLSEFATLPFLAAFDVPPNPKAQTPQKRITYIALAKKIMPMLVDLFLRFKAREEIYIDGTIEAVLSAYSIPVKLKYDCPPASKFGHDLPLWKTATSNFLRVVKECVLPMQTLGDVVPDEHIEAFFIAEGEKESGDFFPRGSEAERRISFFAQSLTTDIPAAIPLDAMPTFTVLTPALQREDPAVAARDHPGGGQKYECDAAQVPQAAKSLGTYSHALEFWSCTNGDLNSWLLQDTTDAAYSFNYF
ncbi:hypothetical protein DFH09DRAFT_1409114 [Mycena vulgaris]|nr:hypothetical protein DFH09DRAFT_1409114 [Mycena vulgaris]